MEEIIILLAGGLVARVTMGAPREPGLLAWDSERCSLRRRYVYDPVGKIRQVTDPTGTYGSAYDGENMVILSKQLEAAPTGEVIKLDYPFPG